MRLLPTYRHDFDSIAEARAFMKNREVTDYTVKAGEKDWGFDGDLIQLEGDGFPISDSFIQAFSHFMEPSIPINFAREIPPDLFGVIGNRLLRRTSIKGRKFQIRVERWHDPVSGAVTREVAQTIASDKYRWVDHERILDEALAVGDRGKVTLTDRMLRVRTVMNEFTIKPWDSRVQAVAGDLHTIGFEILNSETRNLALSVMPHIVRVICSNGMVERMEDLEVMWRRRHTGEPDDMLRQVREIINDPERWKRGAEIYAERAEALSRIPLARYSPERDQYIILAGMEDAVAEIKFDLATITNDKDVSDMLKLLGRRESEEPLESLTLYDLHNGITRMARDQEPELRRAIEVFAGKFQAAWTEA